MKTKSLLCGLGWLAFAALLIGSSIFNSFVSEGNQSFESIIWKKNVQVFDGLLSCSLLPDDLNERVTMLKEELFTDEVETEELEDGYLFFFEDEGEVATKLLDFLDIEKQCCPFFKFDLSILPFKQGMALKISGGPRVKSFIEYYMD